MIEERMINNFTEYLSCFDDEGEFASDVAKENAAYCIAAINKAINNFITGVPTIAHHGFNLNGSNFHASIRVSAHANEADLEITCDDCSGVLTTYCFEPTMKLILNKSYNVVSIENEVKGCVTYED